MSGINITDYSTGEGPGDGEPRWDTAAMQRDFEPLQFMAPYIVVRRRSDGVKGTLQFNHSPRIYWGFEPQS